MLNTRILIATALMACAAGSIADGTKPAPTAWSVTKAQGEAFPDGTLRVDYTSPHDGFRDWALMLPPARGNTWLVQIHGHGSGGDQLFLRPDIRQLWMTPAVDRGLGILTPNLRGNSWMSPIAAEDLRNLIGFVRTRYPGARFLFVSGSMGGTSNLIYASLHPEDVAGVVTLCPATDLASYYSWCRKQSSPTAKWIADAIENSYGGTPTEKRKEYASHSALALARRLTMPVYVSHGTADDVIPVSQSRQLVGKMGDARDFVYVEIPDGGHDSPLAVATTALEWLIAKPHAR